MEEEKETQCNNIQENSGKRFKWSSIQTSPDTLQDNPDWISRLPDSLLLHILSQLGIEEVAKTCILSKRWRYLWTSLSCLDFRNLEYEGKIEKATFIDGVLSHHDDSKVDKLFIELEYEEKHAPLVDSWIQFAIRHKVEEFKLGLFDEVPPEDLALGSDYTLYKLPPSLFTCGSLTDLELSGCDLNLPARIQLHTLKTLYLEYIDLDPFAIEHITCNCPLLENLCLGNCNKSIDLNICITNDNIKNLKIFDYDNYESDNGITIINAPNLISLQFCDGLPKTNYHVEQFRSPVIVDFCVGENIYFVTHVLYGVYPGCDFPQLLHHLRYVKEVRLNSWCIQALTAKEIRGLARLSNNATCIKIELGLTKWELPGIAYLLQSSSYLETLDIHCCFLPQPKLSDEFLGEYDFDEKDFWKAYELHSSSILQNTKTIKISGFHSSFHVKDIKHWEIEMELVRFLLKTSKVLERMIIETRLSSRNKIELMPVITQKLTSFPKASPKAGLFIT